MAFHPGSIPAAILALASVAAPAMAQQAASLPEPYEAAVHNDWSIMCERTETVEATNCEMYQLLRDASDSPIAEISVVALPFGSEFAAGATITTPLETFLPTGMGWHVGSAENMRVEPFRVCTVVGCIVRMGLTPEDVDGLKAGSAATITIAPFVQIDQPIEISVSLSGFTAAYDELQTRLSEEVAAQRAQGN